MSSVGGPLFFMDKKPPNLIKFILDIPYKVKIVKLNRKTLLHGEENFNPKKDG